MDYFTRFVVPSHIERYSWPLGPKIAQNRALSTVTDHYHQQPKLPARQPGRFLAPLFGFAKWLPACADCNPIDGNLKEKDAEEFFSATFPQMAILAELKREKVSKPERRARFLEMFAASRTAERLAAIDAFTEVLVDSAAASHKSAGRHGAAYSAYHQVVSPSRSGSGQSSC
ncbi:hypothetical protein [Polymorphobacter megasporae]|uniref:hypothetical protein n=1 Tax=Glacieibacterium megasporae TaxID=2835787 RepID=UPI001C1E4F68|nr:hypothetical protein [Polymorphobacter megasporae]UAJ11071.1 hypothetical protein KTC28_05000 [Polymorphobacter megasporae]